MGFGSKDLGIAKLAELEYLRKFRAVFAQVAKPLSAANYARAPASYQARPTTPAPFDRFLAEDGGPWRLPEGRAEDLRLDGLRRLSTGGGERPHQPPPECWGVAFAGHSPGRRDPVHKPVGRMRWLAYIAPSPTTRSATCPFVSHR